jgi:hypothetical protein
MPPFFLEKLGIKLAKFEDVKDLPVVPMVAEIATPKLSFISALGFEILDHDSIASYDPTDTDVRMKVFQSFSRMGMYIQDTRTLTVARFQVTDDNDLLCIVPTVNLLCPKLHVEDNSPLGDNKCNHDDVACKDVHVSDNTIVIEPVDCVSSNRADAMFMIKHKRLHFVRGKDWVPLGNLLQLPDGYYTLNQNNF